MFHVTPEMIVALAVQLIGYGAIRQQVKNLADAVAEEKVERKQLEQRVRDLEITRGLAKTAGL